MTYGIINRETKKYFAGFKNNEVTWTGDKRKAWANTKLHAEAQASLFHSQGVKVQQKPVGVRK